MTDRADPPGRAVVIGGGISGLAAARALVAGRSAGRASVEVVLLEASDRLGGNIRTEHADGFLLDAGPDSFVTTKPHAIDLCRAIGLGDRLIGTDPASRAVYVLRRGAMHPLPEGLVLGVPTRVAPLALSPLFSPMGKLRMLRDLLPSRRPPPGDDPSIGDFFRGRLGDEFVRVLAEPLLGGIFAGDAYRLSLRSTFPQFYEIHAAGRSLVRSALAQGRRARRGGAAAERRGPGGPGAFGSVFASLVGGMQELCDTLARSLPPGTVRLRAPARAIERAPAGLVVTTDGGEAIPAAAVVVALPPPAAARVIDAIEPDAAARLREIPCVSSAAVYLGFARADVAHPLDASGFLVVRDEPMRCVAATFSSSKWAGRAPDGAVLLRAFVGGARDEGVIDLDDAALVRLAVGELGPLLGFRGAPRLARVFRHAAGSPQPVVGHADRVARVRERLARHPGLHLVGNAYDGIGIPDCVRQGEAAAAEILKRS